LSGAYVGFPSLAIVGICGVFLFKSQIKGAFIVSVLLMLFTVLGVFRQNISYKIETRSIIIEEKCPIFRVASLSRLTASGNSKMDLLYFKDEEQFKIEANYSGDNLRLPIGSFVAVENPTLYSLKPTHNPVSFDYQSYLIEEGYSARLFINPKEAILCSKGNLEFLPYFKRWQIACEEFIIELPLGPRSKELLPALLLGSKNRMSAEFKDSFKASGVIHLLAVSGLHLGLVYVAFSFIFSSFKMSDRSFQIITILPLWLYAGLVGFTISVVRSAFMFTALGLSSKFKKKDVLTNWMAAASILLFLNPSSILDIGFQLSFSAVAGILILYPFLRKYAKSKNKFLEFVFKGMSISLAAQIATFPIIYYHFGTFPLYFLPANLIIIPLITLIHYLSSCIVLISSLILLPDWIYAFIEFLIESSFQIAHFISALPFAVLHLQPLKLTAVITSIVVVLIVFVISRFKLIKYNKKLLIFLIPFAIFGFIQSNKTVNELCFHQVNKGWMVSYNTRDSVKIFHSEGVRLPDKIEYILKPLSKELRICKIKEKWVSLPGGLLRITQSDTSDSSLYVTGFRWLLKGDISINTWELTEFNKEGVAIFSGSLSDTALIYTD